MPVSARVALARYERPIADNNSRPRYGAMGIIGVGSHEVSKRVVVRPEIADPTHRSLLSALSK